jgi:exopolysaccharide production protein ExoQ
MPPQLALAICTTFVLYLLRLDRRQARDVSWTLWIPTLWMIIVASRPIDIWLGISGGSRETGGVVDPFVQSGLLCFGLIILAKRSFSWSEAITNNVWLVVLVGFMFISIIWSDIAFISLKRCVRELTAVIMAFLVLTEAVPRKALESLLRRTVYVVVPFSLLLIKYFPTLGVVYSRWTGEIQWIGVGLQKNGLGSVCLISVFFLAWTLIGRWQGRNRSVSRNQTRAEALLLLITLWLLKGPSMWAASATAIYALVGGLVTFVALLWMQKYRIQLGAFTWVAIIGSIIALGVITPLVGGSTVTAFTSGVSRDATLTGRTEIWAGLLPDVTRHPVFGYGFGSFWTAARIYQHDIGEAHNGYLEVCLGLGFVGLLLTGMFLLSTTNKAATLMRRDYDWGALCICVLVMTAIHNITESSAESFTSYLMANVLLLSVCMPGIPIVLQGKNSSLEIPVVGKMVQPNVVLKRVI